MCLVFRHHLDVRLRQLRMWWKIFFFSRMSQVLCKTRISNTGSVRLAGKGGGRERPLLFFRNKRPTFQAKESIWLFAQYAIEIRVGRTVDHFHSGNKVSSTPVPLLLSSQSIFDIDVDETRIRVHVCTRQSIYTFLKCFLLH